MKPKDNAQPPQENLKPVTDKDTEADIFDAAIPDAALTSEKMQEAERARRQEAQKKARAEVAKLFGGPEDLGELQLIRASDFETAELIVSLENPSTSTALNDPSLIRVSELQEKAIVFEIPGKKFAKGHSILLNLTCKGLKDTPPIHLKSTGKIVSCEPMPDGTDQIVVSLVQYNEKYWDDIKEAFSRRQDEILKFFQTIKEG